MFIYVHVYFCESIVWKQVHTHVWMCTCACTHRCVLRHTCASLDAHLCMYACIYEFECLSTNVCINVSMYVFMYVHVYVCIYLCMHMHVYMCPSPWQCSALWDSWPWHSTENLNAPHPVRTPRFSVPTDRAKICYLNKSWISIKNKLDLLSLFLLLKLLKCSYKLELHAKD